MSVAKDRPWLAQILATPAIPRPLAGQAALVTGASSGIGRATAVLLAQAGARIGLIGRRREALDVVAAEIQQAGGEGWPLVADVSDRQAVETAVARCLDLGGGRLDLLVNNAGINTKRRSLLTISPEDWERVIAINLTGAFWCTRAVLPVMRRQRDGLIIYISSMAGRGGGISHGSGASQVAYSAAKHGMASLSASTNQEGRSYGVRSCVIYPGEVDTPILDVRPIVPPAEARPRMMQAEDIAATVLFVATLPRRVNIEEIAMRPTVPRDMRAERVPA